MHGQFYTNQNISQLDTFNSYKKFRGLFSATISRCCVTRTKQMEKARVTGEFIFRHESVFTRKKIYGAMDLAFYFRK